MSRHRHHKRSTASLRPTAETRKAPTRTGAGAPTAGSATAAYAPTTGVTGLGGPNDTKTTCVDAGHISLMEQFDLMVGFNVNCEMVFNDASTTWVGWENPWFLHTDKDMMFGSWALEPNSHRQLIITQNLFPSSENTQNWLQQGANGDFEPYARILATNLVNAGLGNSIIRLAHEANGTWYPYSIPNTPTGDAEWIQLWRDTALAMKSVPGAHFRFDWTVAAGHRNVPLTSFYPGDDVVNIIGIDVYDSGITTQTNRWQHFYTEPMGVQEVLRFAQAHGKPLSIPEWGLEPAASTSQGGNDDPGFVEGLASVVANNNVAYQSYFNQAEQAMQLMHSPASIAAYTSAFGPSGYAVNPANQSLTPFDPTTPPPLTITGGPAYGSTITSNTTMFTFQTTTGLTPTCKLDGGSFRACSTTTSDTLTGLAPGFHTWTVQVMDANAQISILYEQFYVAG